MTAMIAIMNSGTTKDAAGCRAYATSFVQHFRVIDPCSISNQKSTIRNNAASSILIPKP